MKLATTDPRVFCALLKTIPLKIAGDEDDPFHVVVRAVDRPPDETREEWLARRASDMAASALDHQGKLPSEKGLSV